VSQRYADWLGLSVRQIVGRPIVDVLGEDVFTEARPHIEAVLRGTAVEYEAQVVVKGLGPRWLHVEYSPTLDASGRPDGWISAITDITDRKLAEDRLSSNNEALSMLHQLSARLTRQDALQTLLDAVVEAAIIVTGADMGTLRLFDATTKSLCIVAHAGFGRAFLDYFREVRDSEDVCALAQEERRRVIVEDVRESSRFAGTEALVVMEEAGARVRPSAGEGGWVRQASN
jgi:PAS domain S-box-containing protein